MKVRNLLSIMLLLFAALTVQGCSDSDDAPSATSIDVSVNKVSVESLTFQLPASSRMVGVSCDADWTAEESDTTWLKISNHAGYGLKDSLSYMRVSVTRNNGAARTGTITIRSGSLSKVITVNQSGIGLDPNDPFESSYDFVGNLVLGYNLGNTFDSNPYGSWWDPTGKTPDDWATQWGQPVVTKETIHAIAARGFNIIRVPVTWYPHIAGFDSGDYTIDEAWMARVQEVIDWVLDEGCYCIINVMHDTGANNGSGDPNSAWLHASMADYDVMTVKYQAIWQQIANRFKDYGEKLIFESFNEILDENSTWDAPTSVTDDSYECINKLQQDFVNTVRNTGGNNEYRNLLITTYSATGNNVTALEALQVPTDVHPSHIVGTVHSYDPYNFCNDGGDYNITMFDTSCQESIDQVFSNVESRFNTLGIPYIFGEFGAIDDDKNMNERIKYATYVAQKMKAAGTTGLWWMGLIDRTTNTWYEDEIVTALFSNIQ